MRDTSFAFTDAEVEFLAEQAHARWMEERLAEGWTDHSVRNNERKQHNNLIPSSELEENVKDDDRDIFRQLPKMLARANFVLQPIGNE